MKVVLLRKIYFACKNLELDGSSK